MQAIIVTEKSNNIIDKTVKQIGRAVAAPMEQWIGTNLVNYFNN